jgi:hypothetical protein
MADELRVRGSVAAVVGAVLFLKKALVGARVTHCNQRTGLIRSYCYTKSHILQ